MKYSSYGMLTQRTPLIAFTVYDGQNHQFKPLHEVRGRLLPFAVFLFSHDTDCHVCFDGGEHTASPGEALILPHNVRHDFQMGEGHITWSHIFLTADSVPLVDLYRIPVHRSREEGVELLPVLEQINSLVHQPGAPFSTAVYQSIELQRSIMELCRLLLREAEPLTEALPFGAESGFFRLLSYINTHIDEPYSFAKLLELSELSEPRLRKLFHSHFGRSPIDYVINRKLLAACQLLAEEGTTVSHVSRALGYEDPMYFSKQFKKHLGLSPSEYKTRIFDEK